MNVSVNGTSRPRHVYNEMRDFGIFVVCRISLEGVNRIFLKSLVKFCSRIFVSWASSRVSVVLLTLWSKLLLLLTSEKRGEDPIETQHQQQFKISLSLFPLLGMVFN